MDSENRGMSSILAEIGTVFESTIPFAEKLFFETGDFHALCLLVASGQYVFVDKTDQLFDRLYSNVILNRSER